MSRRLLAATLAALTLVGCAPKHGTVTYTSSTYNSKTRTWTYQLCARDGDGTEGCEPVPIGTFIACHPGDRWPDCAP